MPYVGFQGPYVVTVTPKKHAEDVPTNAIVQLVLATDILNAQPDTLSAAIKVRAVDTGEDVPGTLSYGAKTITFIPNGPWNTNTQYSVTYLAGILFDINGDSILTAYTTYFTTAAAQSPSPPTLLAPAANSLTRQIPTLTWQSSGATHEVQIARDASFNVIIEDVPEFAGLSFTPVALDVECQYYWRVRAIDNGAHGEWSPVWTFYYGEPTPNGVAPSQYAGTAPFTVLSVTPQPGTTFVTDGRITATCSYAIDETSVPGSIAVHRSKITDDAAAQPTDVTISDVECSGSTLSFTLIGSIAQNYEYTVTLKDSLRSTDGLTLDEDTLWTFTGALMPHYTTVELVRLDIGPFIGQFSDYEISRIIHEVSKWADAIGEGEVTESNIQHFRCYTRYATAIKLLNRAIMDMATRQGDRVRLGDFDIGKDGSLVPDINMSMKDIRALMVECEARLRGNKNMARPGVIHKGERRYPYSQPPRSF
jgi:hypothetical protein